MRDYSVLNGMIENQKSELRTAYDKGYNQGVKDFDLILATSKKEEEGYNRGLESAWACCKRFWQSDENTCRDIFNIIFWEDFFDLSPSEAIKKFKEYDEKHFDVPDNCKIEVGDEIVYSDPLKGEEKGIVMGICNNWVEVKFLKSWNCVGVHKDSVKKTGRHFFWCGEKHEISANDVRLRKKEPSRRALRLSQGLCADCGARPPMEGYTFCERYKALRDKHRAMTSSPWKEIEEMNGKERLAKKKNGMTLDEISAAAYKEGISYGEYVAKYKL